MRFIGGFYDSRGERAPASRARFCFPYCRESRLRSRYYPFYRFILKKGAEERDGGAGQKKKWKSNEAGLDAEGPFYRGAFFS